MQSLRESDLSADTSIPRWHPKLTPYRLLVLVTTAGVGTAKAITAQEGNWSASTTLEWVSGVVIFLILHSMSTYDETPKDPPPLLGWLFTVDCMDYLWRLLSLLRIPRPSYSSEPEPIPRFVAEPHEKALKINATPITLYRLFVCVTTVILGLTKAIVSYSGYSAGANWIDWTLGVVVTSILFILGMYENNSVGMWHAFFVSDYSTQTQHGLGAAFLSFAMLISIGVCVWMISLTWTDPDSMFLSTDDVRVPLSTLTPLPWSREILCKACLSLFMALVVVITAYSCVGGVASILSSSELPRWKDAGEWMMGDRPAWKDGYTALEPQGRRIWKKVTYHVVPPTTFLIGCAVYLAFWIVSVILNVEEIYTLQHSKSTTTPESKPYLGYLIFLGIAILFQTSCAAATTYLMWLVTWGWLLPPLWEWRSGVAG